MLVVNREEVSLQVGVVMGMVLVASSQPNKIFKFFSSKLYKIRARPLDFLVQNVGPFTTPICKSSSKKMLRKKCYAPWFNIHDVFEFLSVNLLNSCH